MKLLELKCPSCGSILSGEPGKKVKCKYCQSEVIIDEEIIKVNHYDGYKDEQIKNVKLVLFILMKNSFNNNKSKKIIKLKEILKEKYKDYKDGECPFIKTEIKGHSRIFSFVTKFLKIK